MTVFFHAHIDELEYMLRIAIAALCGGIIGFERSRMRKEAGLRTHIIVAVGAALLMIVSKYGFTDILDTPGIRVDGSRVAANVITGISFLGAGVIFVRDWRRDVCNRDFLHRADYADSGVCARKAA